MEFGLGEFLVKFEEYFGRTAARCLAALIGVCVAAVAIHFIAEYLVIPVYSVVSPTVSGGNATTFIARALTDKTVQALAVSSISMLAFIFLASLVTRLTRGRWLVRSYVELKQASDMWKKAQDTFALTARLLQTVIDTQGNNLDPYRRQFEELLEQLNKEPLPKGLRGEPPQVQEPPNTQGRT